MVLATQTLAGRRFRSVPELWPSSTSMMHSAPSARINLLSVMKKAVGILWQETEAGSWDPQVTKMFIDMFQDLVPYNS